MNERGAYLLSILALFLVLWLIGYQVHHEIYREDWGMNGVYVPTRLLFHGRQENIIQSVISTQTKNVNQVIQHKGGGKHPIPVLVEERDRFFADFSKMLFAMKGGKKPEYLQLRIFLNKQQKMLENNYLKHEEAQENIRLLQTYLPEYQHELHRASAKLKTSYT